MTTPTFATADGLRLLLLDLAYAGPDAWKNRPDAAELLAFTMQRYGALAHKHGLEPTDAAIAALEAMRTRAVRVAEDPWAVVTHAVQLSLIYESRAEGLLCSAGQARKTADTDLHDAERLSEREGDLTNYHPAFHVQDNLDHVDQPEQEDPEGEPTNAYFALAEAAEFFVELGWQPRTATLGLEYIAARLIRTGNRFSAFESLRRDGNGEALLDIDHQAWLVVLRVALGNHHPDHLHTAAGRGVLQRLLTGEHLDELFADEELADAVQLAAPAIRTKAEHDV